MEYAGRNGRGASGGLLGIPPRRQGAACATAWAGGKVELPPRTGTGIAELDRVLGGGLVPASVVLVGGDPGIGKSTLLLQAASRLAGKGERVLYISGEEAVDQIRLRAIRLGVVESSLDLAASINVADIVATLEAEPDVKVVVIDSIQTMWLETVDSAPGTVSQVRACAFELIRPPSAGASALFWSGM